MNTKLRALLWEELRVGGAIALTALFAGLLTQLSLTAGLGAGRNELRMAITLGVPLMTLLLLTLNTANSGHLMGGFSPRILRLPVETWSAVLVILATRLMAVLVVTSAMAAASWGLFGKGPGADTILILGMAYLLVQVFDWLRDAALQIVVPVLAMLLGLLLLNTETVTRFLSPGHAAPWNPMLLPLAFAPIVAVAYGVSVAAVHCTRRGVKLNLLAPFAAIPLPHLRQSAPLKPFESPLRAQVWFELRRTGVLLPMMTILFWVGFVGLQWLMVWNSGGKSSQSSSTAIYEIVPLLAFLGAAVGWNLRTAGIRYQQKNRPASYLLRLPVEPVDIARARVIAGFLNFAAVFVVVIIVSRLAFLYLDHGVILSLLRDAFANGEISGHEIAALLVGTPLIVGLAGWSIMHLPQRLVIVEFVLLICIWMLRAAGVNALYPVSLACLALALPIPWFAWECVRARRRNLLPTGSLAACLLVWTGFAFAVFPYGSAMTREHPILLIVACASIAVLPVLPFVSTLLNMPGHLTGQRSAATSAQGGLSRQRAVGLGLLLSLLIAVTFLRWTGEPAYKARLRAEGLPGDGAEVKASYPLVPKGDNLAERYLQAGADLKVLTAQWKGGVVKQEATAPQSPGTVEMERPPNVMEVGGAYIENADIIPETVWRETKAYWDQVGAPICEELHTAAHSGLTESRYPIDLDIDQADWTPMSYLDQLRRLSSHLRLKALVSALEGRPEDIATAMRDLNPLAESLKNEPLLISQFTRTAIHGGVPATVERILNRATFNDEDLAQFASILDQGLPPLPDKPMIAPGLLKEMILSMEWKELLGAERSLPSTANHSGLNSLSLSTVTISAMTPALHALGWTAMERLFTVRNCFIILEDYRETARRGYLLENGDDWASPSDHLFVHAPLTCILGPALGRATDSEWRLRTRFDEARAAVAVERYRLANGRLPDRLDELVPRFLDRVPLDLFRDNGPLSYRIKDDGGYVVYSFGKNRIDDRAESKENQADIRFTVAPLALRNRPQIAIQ